MLEPSKPIPSSNRSAVNSSAGIEKCCHSPGTSTNLKSTISTLFFFTKSNASLTAMLHLPPTYQYCSLEIFSCYLTTPPPSLRSNRIFAPFAGADADNLFHRGNKNLSIADLACARSVCNNFNHLRCFIVRYQDLDFYLRQEIDRIFGTAIKLSMALLTPEAFDFLHGHSLDTRFGECIFHLIQLKRLHNRFDHLH